MKYFISTILLSVCFIMNSLAQPQDSISKKHRFQIGVNFSSDYNYRKLENNDNGNPDMDWIIQSRNDMESPKFGYTTGLNGCFMFNSHIGIELGAQYSLKGYQIKDLTFSTTTNPEGAGTGDFRYNYRYIDVPLKVNFQFGQKKLFFFGSSGVVANFFIREIDKIKIDFTDGEGEYTNTPNYDYEPVNFSALLSAGIGYSINSRMTLRVEPTVRYGFTKIINTPITAYFYNAGVNVGYYYAL